MIIGYVRVSTQDQDEQSQFCVLEKNGATKIFMDKASGATMERDGLKKMMTYIRSGDKVIVTELSRLARSTRDLLNIEHEIAEKGATIESIFENVDTSTPQRRFAFIICGATAELERTSILERQRAGIERAKEMGVYKGRVLVPVDVPKIKRIYKMWKDGDITGVQAREMLGMKNNKFYDSVRRYEQFGDPNVNK